MIIRCALVGDGTRTSAYHVDLPSYNQIADDVVSGRALVQVPDIDVPEDVAAFVSAYPTVDLTTPLPVPFPPALALSWAEHLARRYDLGNARWHPVVA
jgi:hypothetical protein